MSKKIIVITGASSGFGRLTADALSKAGHTVYASMRHTTGPNAPQVADVNKFAQENNVDLRPIELDVSSEKSIETAIHQIVTEHGRLDVLIHNAGHMVFGPAEAFTPEQLAELYDANVLSTQRVSRASADAKTAPGVSRLGVQQQFGGRHAAVFVALLRRQGGDGRAGRAVRS